MLVRRVVAVVAIAAGIALVPLATPAEAKTTVSVPKVFISILRGANEVNGGDPKGMAIAAATLNAGSGRLCYILAEHNLQGDVTAAHIHIGAAGTNGKVVVPLKAPVNGFSHDCITIDTTLAQDIAANPRGYYFNIHTTAFPGGAVRGQLR